MQAGTLGAGGHVSQGKLGLARLPPAVFKKVTKPYPAVTTGLTEGITPVSRSRASVVREIRRGPLLPDLQQMVAPGRAQKGSCREKVLRGLAGKTVAAARLADRPSRRSGRVTTCPGRACDGRAGLGGC